MWEPYVTLAGKVQDTGMAGDALKLQQRGFKPYTAEAVPQYTAWIREDLCLSAALLGIIAEELRWIRRCAMALVVICGLVAFKLFW